MFFYECFVLVDEFAYICYVFIVKFEYVFLTMKKFRLVVLMCCMTMVVSAQGQNDSTAERSVKLQELVVKESLVKHSAKSDIYAVTEELRKGADGIMQLLGQLPGVVYNNIDNSITVRNDAKVQILVNGDQVSSGYVNALSLDRIDKVEVIYAPSARFSMAGYKYVIDIKLKPEYLGHDIYVGNFTMISAGNNNGDDVVANEQPQAMYMYSGDKVDFNVGYAFGEINWHYPLSYTKSYPGINEFFTDEYNEKNPNDHNSNRTHAVFTGLDWHIKSGHTLSVRAMYENTDIGRRLENSIHTIYAMGAEWLQSEATVDRQQADNVTGALIYRGKFKEKWDVYASLGYNRLNADVTNSYTLHGSYASEYLYRNTRDYLSGNFDLTYTINDAMWLNAGYIGTWNRYDSHLSGNDMLVSRSTDSRHNAYVYYDYMPRQNMMLHIGSGVEYIRRTDLSGIDNSYWNWLPQVTFTYMPTEKVQLIADYKTQMGYPLQYQLSTSGYDIDSLMRYEGNPLLAPSRTHSVSLSASVGNSFYAALEYNTTHDFMTEWYTTVGTGKFLSTFANARYHSIKAIVGYDWKMSKYVIWSNTVQVNFDKIRLGNLVNDYTNFNMVSQLRYWLAPWKMQFSGEYCRNMMRVPQLQGWSDYGQDMWQLMAQKAFLNNRLSVSLIYVPPLHLGVRTHQRSCVETPFYHTVQTLNLKTYDNMLLVRLQFRFNTGKFRQGALRDNFNVTKEQKKDRGLM